MSKRNSWIEALKEYNKGGSWCVYKKGSKEYDEVKKIQQKNSVKQPEKKTLNLPETTKAKKDKVSIPVKKATRKDGAIMPTDDIVDSMGDKFEDMIKAFQKRYKKGQRPPIEEWKKLVDEQNRIAKEAARMQDFMTENQVLFYNTGYRRRVNQLKRLIEKHNLDREFLTMGDTA